MPELSFDQIQFIEYSAPALPGGTYAFLADVSVQTSVSNPITLPNSWQANINIQASAPRFKLSTGDVYSITPPNNAVGDYVNVVPSIHFNNASLPWVRKPNGSPGHTPWLALVCITPSEQNEVSITNTTVKAYCDAHALTLEQTDVGTDPLAVLSVPGNYHYLLPPVADLHYTAAVKRSVQIGDVASLMGNRLPAVGKNIVYLVSLENYNPQAGTNTDTWQFPVLYSWSFEALDPMLDVDHLLVAMAQGDLTFRLPAVPYDGAQDPVSDPNNWLKYGYVLLPHQFRNGQTSVSWYKGPLAAAKINVQPTLPAIGADALSLFDSTIGMLDVSYATAWQLGRQLALQANDFSTALYKWKREMMLLDKSRRQVESRDAALPVLAKVNRWNVLNQAQFAFIRFGRTNTNNKWPDLSGNNHEASFITGNPEVHLNDTFGASVYLNPPNSSGYQYIQINTDKVFSAVGTTFYSFWFQLSPDLEEYKEYGLMSLWTTEQISESRIQNTERLSISIQNEVIQVLSSGTRMDLPPSVWHHMIVVVRMENDPYDSNKRVGQVQVRMPQQSTSISSFNLTNIAGTTTIRFGRCIGTSGVQITPFKGGIANFRAYQTSLNDGDMSLIAQADLAAQKLYPWLNKCAVLKNLPFNYLVPDERMLPPESIRFFKMDTHWMDCFADGAFSVGRFSNATLAEDARLMEHIQLAPYQSISGVLLRSSIVGQITALNIDGFNQVVNETTVDKASHQLQCIRKDTLSDDTLLVLFEGDVQSIQIYPAPEMVHYGFVLAFSNNDPIGYHLEKTLRDANGNATTTTTRISEDEVALRTTRVINIARLVANFNLFLHPPQFTSAEYAMQMLDQTWKVQINAAS